MITAKKIMSKYVAHRQLSNGSFNPFLGIIGLNQIIDQEII
jgi:hypothetical protein